MVSGHFLNRVLGLILSRNNAPGLRGGGVPRGPLAGRRPGDGGMGTGGRRRTCTRDPSSGTATWSTASTNWYTVAGTGGTQVVWTNGDGAIFNNTQYTTSPFDAQISSGAAISAAGLTFNAGVGTGMISSLGGSLTLTGGITIGASDAISLDSSLGTVSTNSEIWTNNSASPFTVNASVQPYASGVITTEGSGAETDFQRQHCQRHI